MNIQSILIVTFCILIGLMLYMSFSLFQIKKLSKKKKSSLSDPRYFELKYQHQLFISVATIIVFLVSFFGWNSLEGIKKNLNKQMSEYDQKFIEKTRTLQNLADKQNKLNETFGLFEENVTKKQEDVNGSVELFKQKLDNNTLSLNSSLKNAKIQIDSLQIALNSLGSVIAKNPSIYVVKKKVSGFRDTNFNDTLYYKDCISRGAKLPKFKNTPYVISIVAEKSATCSIFDINKDYFQFSKISFGGNGEDSLYAYFMIFDY